jgi:hypothetical protein
MPKSPKALKLRAEDAEDLAIIAAALQDAAVPVNDMRYFPDQRRFMLAVSRYRWEADPGDRAGGGERVSTAVIFDNVQRVRRRGFDPRDGERILELLTVTAADSRVDLVFSGDIAVRLKVGRLDCRMDDFGEPWPTIFRPEHKATR